MPKQTSLTAKEFAESLATLVNTTPHLQLGLLIAKCWYNKPGEIRVYIKQFDNTPLGYIRISEQGTFTSEIKPELRTYMSDALIKLCRVFSIENKNKPNKNSINTYTQLCNKCGKFLADETGVCNLCTNNN